MAPCEPRFRLQSTGEDSSPMMKTILQKIRVELAILGEKKKDNLTPVSKAGRAGVKGFTLRKTESYRLVFFFSYYKTACDGTAVLCRRVQIHRET